MSFSKPNAAKKARFLSAKESEKRIRDTQRAIRKASEAVRKAKNPAQKRAATALLAKIRHDYREIFAPALAKAARLRREDAKNRAREKATTARMGRSTRSKRRSLKDINTAGRAAALKSAYAAVKSAAKGRTALVPGMSALVEQHLAGKGDKRLVELRLIGKDPELQLREATNPDVVATYADAYRAGEAMPPIVLFEDQGKEVASRKGVLYLADGHHRVAAARKAQLAEIDAIIRPGNRRDAVLYAAGANGRHGLPQTNADKRRVVTTLLEDAEWRTWSDREIGKHAHVSPNFVAKVRGSVDGAQVTKRKTKDGREMTVGKIGKSAPPSPQQELHYGPIMPPTPPTPAEIKTDDLRDAQTYTTVNLGGTALRSELEPEPQTLPTPAPAAPVKSAAPQLPERILDYFYDVLDLDQAIGEAALAEAMTVSAAKIRSALSGMRTKGLVVSVHRGKGVYDWSLTDKGSALASSPVCQVEPEVLAPPADEVPTAIILAPLAVRRLANEREQLIERMAANPGLGINRMGTREFSLMALIVGIDTEPAATWSDEQLTDAISRFDARFASRLADEIRRGNARLPSLATIAGWWNVEADALRILAERAVPA